MATHPVETSTQTIAELWQAQCKECRELMNRHAREMREALRQKFPLGTKVRCPHGDGFVEGTVDGYDPECEGRVIVESPKSRGHWHVDGRYMVKI